MPTRGRYRLLARGRDRYADLSRESYFSLMRAVADNALTTHGLTSFTLEHWGIALPKLLQEALLIRPASDYGYDNASWEPSLRCDYHCRHCYLGPKGRESLDLAGRFKILETLRDLGVYRLHMTGGEPLIDRYFAECYKKAHELGILVRLSSNGSQLYKPELIDLFTALPPLRVTISLYGASAEVYEALTQTSRGSFARFIRSMEAIAATAIPLRISVIVTQINQHQLAEMEALAKRFTSDVVVYDRMTPTHYGSAEPLAVQSVKLSLGKPRPVYTGCDAGTRFFHVDPLGRASICKIGRDPSVDLLNEGVDGIVRLQETAKELLRRSGGCQSCGVQSICVTCPPMVRAFQTAQAPTYSYCQH